MADSSEKLLAKLSTLEDSLDDLEEKLEPLLAQTLPESLLSLDTIQQVKLNVALPYLVYDLIFIYLKTRGIDPKAHPVVAELDRVRQYFDKIKNAEDPEQRKTAVDKAAADRFIKHAIAQVKEQRTPGEFNSASGPFHIRFDASGHPPSPSSSQAVHAPVKMTSKMLARAEYQKQLAAGHIHILSDPEDAEDVDEADVLEVFDDDEGKEKAEIDEGKPVKTSSKTKGKGKAVDGQADAKAAAGKKRGRPAMDPFAGYGDDAQASPRSTKALKKTRMARSEAGEDMPMEDDTTPRTVKSKMKTGKRDAKAKKQKKHPDQ